MPTIHQFVPLKEHCPLPLVSGNTKPANVLPESCCRRMLMTGMVNEKEMVLRELSWFYMVLSYIIVYIYTVYTVLLYVHF